MLVLISTRAHHMVKQSKDVEYFLRLQVLVGL